MLLGGGASRGGFFGGRVLSRGVGGGGGAIVLAVGDTKLAQADATAARQAEAINLGIPAYRDIAATLAAPGDPHDH
jgi:hypothetical protein